MHLYKQKRLHIKGLVITVTVFAVVVAIFLYGFISATNTVRSQQKALLEKAIDRAVINCYAIEGSYPESVAYLEEHYGVVINHEK